MATTPPTHFLLIQYRNEEVLPMAPDPDSKTRHKMSSGRLFDGCPSDDGLCTMVRQLISL